MVMRFDFANAIDHLHKEIFKLATVCLISIDILRTFELKKNPKKMFIKIVRCFIGHKFSIFDSSKTERGD